MSWLSRFLPSRAAVIAVLTAVAALILAVVRRDARHDQTQETKIEDHEHAQDIADSVARDRADPERLRPFEGRGYRD